jgi:AraC family transcriptional regulator of arabinose operon
MVSPSPRFIEHLEVPLITGHSRMKPRLRCVRPTGFYEWLLWYNVRGRCRVIHDKGEFISEPGELVLIVSGIPQNYGTINLDQTWECIWAVLEPRTSWKELLDWPQAGPGVMRLNPQEPDIRRKILQSLQLAHRFASVHSRRHQDFAMNALESALLWCDIQNPKSQMQQMDARMCQAIEAITRDLAHKWTLSAIARAAGVSEPHAVRLFRRYLSISPLQYVEQRRIERARQLLQHTVNRISDISDELGFESPFYFSLRFKKHLGVNPRTYRQQSQETPKPR